jgi:23S rRNA pseudouridine2605 synthase
VLAAAGVASRRAAEELILAGRVEVDGETITALGTRVDRTRQAIHVDGEQLPKPQLVYYAVHKPVGVVCTSKDPAGRPRVTDLLPEGLGRIFSVGRLDMSSEGLIVLTNDGALANQLTHPRHGVEKTYHVQVVGYPTVEVLGRLRKGMHLAEGFAQVVQVRIKSRRKNGAILEMVLDEGRNREVRRLLARVGHRVQRLTRVAIGPLRLGEMPAGTVRRLTPDEVKKLRAAVRTGRQKPRGVAEPRLEMPGRRKRQQQAAAGKKITRPSRKGARR